MLARSLDDYCITALGPVYLSLHVTAIEDNFVSSERALQYLNEHDITSYNKNYRQRFGHRPSGLRPEVD
jgi:hypothetical protein